MTCEDYGALLDKYMAGDCTPEEEALLRAHEAICSDCAARHEEEKQFQAYLETRYENIMSTLSALAQDVPPPPADFHEGWTKRVEEDAMMRQEQENRNASPARRGWLKGLSVAAAAVFVIGGALLTRDTLAPRNGAGQTIQQTTAYDAKPEMDFAASDVGYGNASVARSAPKMTVYSAETGAADEIGGQKIIRTVTLTIATGRYDDCLEALQTLCQETGGNVTYLSEDTGSGGVRRASVTLRVPADKVDGFLDGAAAAGRVTHREETASDVTESYQDTQARLETQEALMARLQALMTDTGTLSDLLELESKIAETQYTIDSLRDSLNRTDRRVDYTTVDVTVREETDVSGAASGERPLLERLQSGFAAGWGAFVDFLEDAVVFLTAALPFLAVVALAWGIVHLARKHRKKA